MSDSALLNADLAPVPPEQRTWSMWHVAALWVGMAVCIPTYMLAASMIAQGMSWWQAILTVSLGNCVVLVPMILNGHAGTKYGVPFPVLVRSSFGTVGAHVPSIARGLVGCGWFGIQTWIGGSAIYTIDVSIGWVGADDAVIHQIPGLGISATQLLCFLGFWAWHVYVVFRGLDSIKFLETWASPFLLACGLALLAWAVLTVDQPGDLFTNSNYPAGSGFWTVFFPQLTAMVGFWSTLSLNIPDFTRYCRDQRQQALGQLLGLPTTMTLFAFVGIVVTAASVAKFGRAIWDPVELVKTMHPSAWIVAVALLAIVLATITTNVAANIVSPANGFSNLWPRRIGFRTGAMITCLIGVVMMPWKILDNLRDYTFTWLIGYSALLGPIAGIMLCDYFVIRRTRLDQRALYDSDGPYAGVNWRAMIALIVAVLPNIPGFVNAVTGRKNFGAADPLVDTIYGNAWFLGLAIAAAIYWLLTVLMTASARPDAARHPEGASRARAAPPPGPADRP